MATRSCQQCGATVDVAENTLSTTCAFCDSPLVDSDAAREPVDQIVPFEVPRDRASGLLASFLQDSWMAPESVRRATRPDELRNVFVPFYAYDAVARTRFSARVGIYWYRTETYTTFVDGKPVTRTRQVRETDWHPFQGTHARRWLDHLVSASRGLPEVEANELEPFDLGRAIEFAPAATAGVEAEHPTVPKEAAHSTAVHELQQLEHRTIAGGHLPGDTHDRLKTSSEIDVEGIRLVLMPVWIAVFSGPKGPIRLLVNGQTGEVVGDVPRSWWKIGCLVALIVTLLLSVIAFATMFSAIVAAVAGVAS